MMTTEEPVTQDKETPGRSPSTEAATLKRAQSGNGDAFDTLVGPYRRELLVHCYRSLGSMNDAEDVLQEVMVAAWRALDRFDGRSLRAWLYRIATNRCLNHVRDESRRPKAAAHPQLAASGIAGADDPWWLEPIPDQLLAGLDEAPEARYDAKESIALAFVAGLQQLPPQQRSVLVLRDVLGYPASETAEILGTTPTSVNSALIRARSGFRPERSPDRIPLQRSADESAIVDQFVDAFQRGDISSVVGILSDDATLSMPPQPIQCNGAPAVIEYLQQRRFWGSELRLVPTRSNGQPALAYYLPDPSDGVRRANGLMVLTISGDLISALTRFDRAVLKRFDVPTTLL